MGTLHEDVCTFMTISRCIIIGIKNVSDRFGEKIKTRILYSVTFFGKRAVYEMMWKNMVQPDSPQKT
jgi:hypothetical protein